MPHNLICSFWTYTQSFELIEGKKTDSLVSTLLSWWTTKTHCLHRIISLCVCVCIFFPGRLLRCSSTNSPLCTHHWAEQCTEAIGRFTLGVWCLPSCRRSTLSCYLWPFTSWKLWRGRQTNTTNRPRSCLQSPLTCDDEIVGMSGRKKAEFRTLSIIKALNRNVIATLYCWWKMKLHL